MISQFRIVILIVLNALLTKATYSQPGPSSIGLEIYSSNYTKLALKKDIDVFTSTAGVYSHMDAYEIQNAESACHNKTIINAVIIIESKINIVAIVFKKDTMKIIIKDYSYYGNRILLDSVVFTKGCFELQNLNYIDAGGNLLNKMNLTQDVCNPGYDKIPVKYIIPLNSPCAVTTKPKQNKTENISSNNDLTIEIKENDISVFDSSGVKYIKCNYMFQSKNYSSSIKFPKNFTTGKTRRIFITLDKKNPSKIEGINSYPHGY